MSRSVSLHTLKSRLLALMLLRAVLALAFLGIAGWFQLRQGPILRQAYLPLFVIVAAIGVVTILYASFLKYVGNLRLFAYVQITADVALITAIIYVTGGVESYLAILYYISVVGSNMLLDKRGGYYAASLSVIIYGVLMDLDFYGVLPQGYKVFHTSLEPSWDYVLTSVATNALGLFTVAYLMGQHSEKTARVQRELEEKEIDYDRLENLNRLIVDNIPTGIMTLDGQRRITSFNRAASEITGYSLQKVYYRSIDEVFDGLLDHIERPHRDGERMERVVRKSGGEEICLGFNVSPGKGGDIDSIVIFQDLTKLKVLEEQLRRDDKLKALGELSASLAHEIRNPLASISGSIQFLGQELKLDGERGHLMEIILREAKRLDSLITDFLLFARPASKEKADRIDISEMIEETIKVFRNSPQASGISIDSNLAGRIRVEGDRRQISQVLWNLFLNAASAMDGHGRLTVSSELKDLSSARYMERPPGAGRESGADDRYAEILVSDTGRGIEQASISKIFDPFYSTKHSGTGMGLALVHRIIESHGGTIEVRSGVGEGTTFRILLPVKAEHTLH